MAQHAKVQQMVFTELAGPFGELLTQLLQDHQSGIQLNAVALAVVKSDGFNALVACQRLGQASGGVLSPRKQNESGGVHERLCALVVAGQVDQAWSRLVGSSLISADFKSAAKYILPGAAQLSRRRPCKAVTGRAPIGDAKVNSLKY